MLWSLLLLHAMVATAIDDKQVMASNHTTNTCSPTRTASHISNIIMRSSKVDEACTWFQHKDVRTWGAGTLINLHMNGPMHTQNENSFSLSHSSTTSGSSLLGAV